MYDSIKIVVIVDGIAVCLSKRVNAKPAANPVFLAVPSRTIVVTFFGSIRMSRPTLSMTDPSPKVVATAIAAAGIKDAG